MSDAHHDEAPALQVEQRDGVRWLVFNRPDKLNVLNLEQHARVIDEIEAAAADAAVRAIAFAGRGRAFCAGDDLVGAKALPERWRRRAVALDIGSGPAALLETCAVIRAVSKPTVAVMHGHALGSGYDYSLSCDFRVATADLNYGDPRIHRALWAAEGWSYKLVRQLDQSAVTPIAYLGRTLTGTEAYARGLVHHLLPARAEPIAAAQAFVARVAALDADAYATTKRRLLAALDQDFATALAAR